MGWWSTDIMGGDTPLDFKSEFYDRLDLDQFKVKSRQAKPAFENMQDKFINNEMDNILNKWGCGKPDDEFYKDYKSIGFQTLAVIMMEHGCDINHQLKSLMLEWIPLDLWASDDMDREKAIGDLVKSLGSYNGETPLKIKSKGLFETMAEIIKPNI